MSAGTIKLLNTASEMVGGQQELAERLGIDEPLLATFMAGISPLPDAVLLKLVDILLENRESRRLMTSMSMQPGWLREE